MNEPFNLATTAATLHLSRTAILEAQRHSDWVTYVHHAARPCGRPVSDDVVVKQPGLEDEGRAERTVGSGENGSRAAADDLRTSAAAREGSWS